MPLSDTELRTVVHDLSKRPGHEKTRTLVHNLLVELGVPSADIAFEKAIWEIRERLDALLGQTVFEFKRDLRRERDDAEAQLERYIGQRERETRAHFVGIATDGFEFLPYELRAGKLTRLAIYRTNPGDPRGLLAWLDAAIVVQGNLDPEPAKVRAELGKESLTYQVARHLLSEMWAEVHDHPEVQLKRQLWADLLEQVYGSSEVGSDELFFQHTYLTMVAKTMAVRVLGIELPPPEDLLSGKPFSDRGVEGP